MIILIIILILVVIGVLLYFILRKKNNNVQLRSEIDDKICLGKKYTDMFDQFCKIQKNMQSKQITDGELITAIDYIKRTPLKFNDDKSVVTIGSDLKFPGESEWEIRPEGDHLAFYNKSSIHAISQITAAGFRKGGKVCCPQ